MFRCLFLMALCCVSPLLSAAGVSANEPLVVSQIVSDLASAQAFRIVREVYRRIGIEVRAELLPNERALLHSNSGVSDAENVRMAGIEASYPNLVQVPEPVITHDPVAFTTGLTFKVEGWESLRPYTICILRGHKVGERGTEGMQRTMAISVDQLILMLRGGRCDVAVLAPQVWLEVDRLKAGPLRALDPPIARVPLYHYVNRRHAELVPRLAEALRQMREDGTSAALSAADDLAIREARQRNTLPDR